MPDLTLERATVGGEHYEVLDEARNVVGTYMRSACRDPWIWTIAAGHHPGRKSTYGYEPTRDAAMQALARSWHREE